MPSSLRAGLIRYLQAACALALTLSSSASPLAVAASDGGPGRGSFAVRMVKLVAPPSSAAAWEHLKFSVEAGFNAIWVYSSHAGGWTSAEAPNRPWLNPAFVRMASWCRRHGVRVVVSVNPVADSRSAFVFSGTDGEQRIARFFRLLRDDAGVKDFVVSFDDQPLRLQDLDDILRYGRSAAPAHLDLTSRLDRSMRRDERLWLCASAYCDAHLGYKKGEYSRPFLEGLPKLPSRIGIVWTGPRVVSPSIRGADIAATRARLGGRKILLYDNYPSNEDYGGALGLILGPLRDRGADLASQVDTYLACPMTEVAASRLPLLTIADYLTAPDRYDPDASAQRAVERLAGADRRARAALAVQAADWGAWIGEPGYQGAEGLNPETVAEGLAEPASRAEWLGTEVIYPDRMAALQGLADAAFRDELLEVMARRLAIARAVPLVREYLARAGAGQDGVEPILRQLVAQRLALNDQPGSLHVFDLFVAAAGLPRLPARAGHRE